MATQIEPATQTDENAFRAEVQQFLADNFPAELKGQSNALAGVDGPTNETPAQTKWREAVGARGWGTPTWPKEYGGGGLTKAQAKIIDQEFAKAGAYNPIGGMGVMMFGRRCSNTATRHRSRSIFRRSAAAKSAGARAIRNPMPALTSRTSRPLPRTRATTTLSTARRPGPAAANGPTSALQLYEPTRATSTRASASC